MAEDIPEGFEPFFVPDGVHHFSRGLECQGCGAKLVGEGNSPKEAKEKAIERAEKHTC